MDPELEEQQYNELQRRTEAGELFWHYTDWIGLRGIIDSREMRATNYIHLNDTGELIRTLSLTKGIFSRTLIHLNRVIEDIEAGGNEKPRLFIASFSKAFDSLEQWRAYSGGSTGFALGFDAKQLNEIAEWYRFRLVPCIYDDQQAVDAAKKFDDDWQRENEKVERYCADPQNSDVDRHNRQKYWSLQYRTVRSELAMAMVLFKDKCFVHEQEVRLISQGLSPTGPSLRPDILEDFRLQGTEIIRFVKVPLVLPQMKTPLLAVMIGPSKESSAVLARDELRLYTNQVVGMPITVASSRRPIKSK